MPENTPPRHASPVLPGQLIARVVGRSLLVAAGLLTGTLLAASCLPRAHAAGLPPNPHRPAAVGGYQLVPRPPWPARLPESHPAWNCFVDGDRRCGPGWQDMRYVGFTRPGWSPLCIGYPDVRQYVMCSDGSTFYTWAWL